MLQLCDLSLNRLVPTCAFPGVQSSDAGVPITPGHLYPVFDDFSALLTELDEHPISGMAGQKRSARRYVLVVDHEEMANACLPSLLPLPRLYFRRLFEHYVLTWPSRHTLIHTPVQTFAHAHANARAHAHTHTHAQAARSGV